MKEKNKKDKTTNELIDALFIGQIHSGTPPKGWYNTWEVAKRYNLSRSHASKKITGFLRAGKMEMRKFRMPFGNSSKIIPYYRVIG